MVRIVLEAILNNTLCTQPAGNRLFLLIKPMYYGATVHGLWFEVV